MKDPEGQKLLFTNLLLLLNCRRIIGIGLMIYKLLDVEATMIIDI